MANMGFVSARFAGTDGVSLESLKWAEVLMDYGNRSFWLAGKLDRDADKCMLVPEAAFDFPDNIEINNAVWQSTTRSKETTRNIHQLTTKIKADLYKFVKEFDIDFLVPENALTIPMHLPLGLAITEFLAETGMPAISHNHDFFWERSRYLVNAAPDFLDMAFPPSLPNIQNVVINSAAQNELAWRKGLAALLIPNVLDFENPGRYNQKCNLDFRADIGLEPDDILILQPTRVVPRKGIEHAIAIVSRLNNPRCKLVVSHESGDEGNEYLKALMELAADQGVDLRFAHTRIGEGSNDDAKYSLWDVYPCADLVTYPSIYEGFGNALLETFFFKKPIVLNRYNIWIEDIEPKGFKAIMMDGYITNDLIKQVENILSNEKERKEMTELNYRLATKHYSYSVLSRSLHTLVTNVTGLPQF